MSVQISFQDWDQITQEIKSRILFSLFFFQKSVHQVLLRWFIRSMKRWFRHSEQNWNMTTYFAVLILSFQKVRISQINRWKETKKIESIVDVSWLGSTGDHGPTVHSHTPVGGCTLSTKNDDMLDSGATSPATAPLQTSTDKQHNC